MENSTVLGLTFTLLARLVSGRLCDLYGPRTTMALLLVLGSIPFAFSWLIRNATDLYIIRFFIGILGGTFVPCQVWTTAFFDKSNVGFANAVAAGIGTAGAGVSFFVFPALFDFFQHLTAFNTNLSWKLTVTVLPLVLLLSMTLIILFFGNDCPQGTWKDHLLQQSRSMKNSGSLPPIIHANHSLNIPSNESHIPLSNLSADPLPDSSPIFAAKMHPASLDTSLSTLFSSQIIALAFCYLCSFGGELALEAYMPIWYSKIIESSGLKWSQQNIGNISGIFGFSNIITRPLGGFLSDWFYNHSRNNFINSKKRFLLCLFLGQTLGYFLLSFIPNPTISITLLFTSFLFSFMGMANGAIFSIVPHICSSRNGYVSGLVGAGGNLGGIIFSIIYRFNSFTSSFWITGTILSCCFIFMFSIKFWDDLRDDGNQCSLG